MTYKEKLEHPKWQEKRLLILQRDGFKCRICGDTETMLHVHHTVYDFTREPWDAEDVHLVTLCKVCHEMETTLKAKNFDLAESLHRSGFTTLETLLKMVNGNRPRIERLVERVRDYNKDNG